MSNIKNLRNYLRGSTVLSMALLVGAEIGVAHAGTAVPKAPSYEVVYSFGSSGYYPQDGMVKDSAGNLYGITGEGGNTSCFNGAGCGTVFKLAPDGTETVLYAFAGGNDGESPIGSVVLDKTGNVYGTTNGGGPSDWGTVFKVAPDGTETVLYTFTGGADGGAPWSGLILGKKGVLYGTTTSGGAYGYGVVFEIEADGTEKVLYAFTGGNDGAVPWAGLIRDKAGNLYGTTLVGGASSDGTIFKVAPDGTETVLHSFAGGNDGANPEAGLTEDSSGNFYGTAHAGGASNAGTVFELTPDGTETTLYSFTGGSDGAYPFVGSLFRDKLGNLYGTTPYGGNGEQGAGKGVVFKVAPDGTETVLHTFTGGTTDGASPQSHTLVRYNGYLYGTTESGGANNGGTIFKIKAK